MERSANITRVILMGALLSSAAVMWSCFSSPDEADVNGAQHCSGETVFDEETEQCVSPDDANSGADVGVGTDADSQSPNDSPSAENHDDMDAGSPDPTDTGDDHLPNSDSGEPDTGTPDDGEPDTGGTQEPQDTGGTQEPQDTGGGDPPECGGSAWDDNHDGEDPWEEPVIDCDDLDISWNCDMTEEEEKFVELMNETRSEEQTCGTTSYPAVGPVEMNETMQCAARIHSWDMNQRSYFDHNTLEGLGPGTRVSLAGGAGGGWGVAENIASGAGTAEGVLSMWMNSPPHCANIMGGYSSVGIGIYGSHGTLKLQ